MPEDPSRIEPTKLAAIGEELADEIALLSASTAILGRALHPATAAGLAEVVAVMNCYYSNLIEGHNTRPHDIFAAMKAQDAAGDVEQRDLVQEALAHIRVQAMIDAKAADGTLPEPASIDFVRLLHREFYRGLPDTLLRITGAGRDFMMVPGEFRSRDGHDVQVGTHVPPPSDSVVTFMGRFEQVYRLEGARPGGGIMAMAAAHHRFAYIHPFPDGNGRVGRLISHAMAHKIGLGAHGLWSISRGLARGLEAGPNGRAEYKAMLAKADMPRQGDLDGRGNLSERALADWVLWFVRVCRDQVEFMSGLFDINGLAERLRRYVRLHDDTLPQSAGDLLVEMLVRGEVERGELPRAVSMPARSARRVIARLADIGLIDAPGPRAPFHLAFPAEALEDLFPRLFPAAAA